MRIAIVANPHFPVPPLKYGGTENVIYFLIKGLLERGHEPILIGTGDSVVDCELIAVAKRSIPYPKRKVFSPAYKRELRRISKNTEKALLKISREVDIIHSHGYDLKNFQHMPNVTTLHNKVEFEDISYFKDRLNYPYISISKNQQGAYPFLNYVRTVYDGEDPELFPIIKNPEKYVCFISRFEREKGPHLAIQLAINMGIKIKLAGKLDYHGASYFREEVRPYLDHPLVEYLGEIAFDEKVKLVGNAMCNLHPINWREPFGLNMIEAGYCGTPTLATRRGSLPEVIDVGRTGYLVEDFIEGTYLLEKCFALDRTNVAETVRKRFNYQRMTRDYIRAYKKITNDYKKGS